MTTSGQALCSRGWEVWVCVCWGKQGNEKLSLSSSGSQAGERHRAFIMISAGGEFEGPS